MISLKGQKVRLRAVEPSDAKLIFEWENNEQNWQLSQTLVPFSMHIINQYVETAHKDIFENKQLRLMIVALQSEKTIGSIDLFDFDAYNLKAGVGVLINDISDRKQGFAKESLELLINYSKDVLMLKQLYCNIGVHNLASISLFESCDFIKTGTKKNWERISSNQWEDIFFFQLCF